MLVLNSKPGEKIVIGDGITLTVVEVRGSRALLAIDAPDQDCIRRAEPIDSQEDPVGSDAVATVEPGPRWRHLPELFVGG